MGFYEGMQDVALGLLQQFGQTLTLQRVVTGAYDATAGTVAKSASTFTVRGAVFDYEDRRVDGALIRRGDKMALLAAKTIKDASGRYVTPDPTSDKVVIGGVAHSIVNVEATSPAGVPVIFECQVRRGD